ncbi:hypothetical protein LIER_36953 [Lithospermum erythrorhizon]|uniref:Uncharacterized protein n=1 Tax=Lithospermum erythrorhizon TaxID=34254 RepID=A0AAV3PF15_LITER
MQDPWFFLTGNALTRLDSLEGFGCCGTATKISIIEFEPNSITALAEAFGNQKWRTMFDKAEIHHLPRLCSDHAPILVHCLPSRPTTGASSFKFQPMWLTHNNFASFIHNHWSLETGIFNHVANTFANKAKVWNREVFGNVHFKLRHITARLEGIQKITSSRDSSFLSNIEVQLVKEYDDLSGFFGTLNLG